MKHLCYHGPEENLKANVFQHEDRTGHDHSCKSYRTHRLFPQEHRRCNRNRHQARRLTLDQIEGAWVQDIKCVVKNGKVSEWRVNLKVTFLLK